MTFTYHAIAEAVSDTQSRYVLTQAIFITSRYRRVKIEYNIKEIATQTKPITFVRLYVYKYRVKTLKLKTLHVYFNLNSKYTNCSFILLAAIGNLKYFYD